MTTPKHSPGPWRTYGGGLYVLDFDGRTLTEATPDMSSVFRRDEDARRIVACVNACAGLPTEALESGALRAALDALVKYQRENRLSHDSDAERFEAAGPALGALGLRRWNP